MIKRFFSRTFDLEHCQEQGGYWQHQDHAIKLGFRLVWYGITSVIHALFPTIFKFHSAIGVIKIYRDLIHHEPQNVLIKEHINPLMRELARKQNKRD
jgi:hypothetical protein